MPQLPGQGEHAVVDGVVDTQPDNIARQILLNEIEYPEPVALHLEFHIVPVGDDQNRNLLRIGGALADLNKMSRVLCHTLQLKNSRGELLRVDRESVQRSFREARLNDLKTIPANSRPNFP